MGRIGLRHLRKVAAAVIACGGLGTGALIASASTASASYGPGATYQIELSGNVTFPSFLDPSVSAGGGVWIWAALTPTSPTGGTVDYEETDCVHNAPIPAPNGGSHNTNVGVASYTVNGNGTLTIEDVGFASGPGATTINVTVADTYGHTAFSPGSGTVTFGATSSPGSGNIAALLDAGMSGQLEVAP